MQLVQLWNRQEAVLMSLIQALIMLKIDVMHPNVRYTPFYFGHCVSFVSSWN